MHSTWSHRSTQLWRYAIGTLGLRRDDVLVASFPKSGNTWVRFFLAHLLSLREWEGRPVDFEVLDRRMVEYGKSNLLIAPTPQTLPRFVKTHLPYTPVFGRRRAILIVRDPRDVMASFYAFEASKTEPRFAGSFSELLRHPRFGLPGWARHTAAWMAHATVVLHYEAMRTDAVEAFTTMLDRLGLEATAEEVAEATRRASQKQVRAVEEARGISRPERFREGFQFARDGRVGKGQALFTAADLTYLTTLLDTYGLDLYRPE